MKLFKSSVAFTLVSIGVITFILTSQRGMSDNGNSNGGNGNAFHHHYFEADFSLAPGESKTLEMPVIDQHVRLSYTMIVPNEAPGGISFGDVPLLFSSSNQTLFWNGGSPIDGQQLGFTIVHSGTNGTFTLESTETIPADTINLHIAFWY